MANRWERLTTEERFWSHVDKRDSGCWAWTSARNPQGYGQFRAAKGSGRTMVRAHRVAYELTNGPVPPGLVVCHRCDNPSCVRPDHLFLGTDKDNMQDAARKGRLRTPRGQCLTAEKVVAARSRLSRGDRVRDIARDLSVSTQAIYHLRRGNSWKHV